MTVTYGVDYSAGAQSWSATKCASMAAALKAAGRTFALRYLGTDWASGKGLTKTEYDALRAQGIKVLLLLEYGTDDALGGASVGTAHAARVQTELAILGLPSTVPVYYCVDTDTQDWTSLGAYFAAIKAANGGSIDAIGCYGGYQVMKWGFNNGIFKYGFQAKAWSTVNPATDEEYYGAGRVLKWDTRSHVRQHGEDQTTVTIDGTLCNADSGYYLDLGQYPLQEAAVGGATTTYAGAEDTYLVGKNASYATARAAATSISANTDRLRFGQQNTGGLYYVYEGFIDLDPNVGTPDGTLANAVSAFDLYGIENYSTTDFTVEVRLVEYIPRNTFDQAGGFLGGFVNRTVTLADWVPGADLSGLTLLASRSTSGWSSTGRNTFTATADLLTAINQALADNSYIRCVITSSRTRLGTSPAVGGDEFVGCGSADAGTTRAARLQFTYVVQVMKELVSVWNVAEDGIDALLDLAWNLYQPVSVALDTTWVLAGGVSKTFSTSWATLGGIEKTLATAWDVASALYTVTKSFSTTWGVGGPVNKTLTMAWRTEVGLAHSIFHLKFWCCKHTKGHLKEEA